MKVKESEENDNEIKPWMSKEVIKSIKSYLNKNQVFFEWGAGGSTIEFSKYVKRYYSVEHDFEWYNLVKNRLKKKANVKIYYLPPCTENLKWFPIFNEGKYTDFKNYVRFVNNIGLLGIKFDVVLIDGRARVDCAIEVLPYLSKDAIVFIHDFDRQYYWKVLKYYEIVDIVDNLVELRRKSDDRM